MAKQTYSEAEKAQYKSDKQNELKATWEKLLIQVVTEPGIISSAYSAFHNYSFGNQIYAAMQLFEREMNFSPIASFNAWKEKGRIVKKGEKAIKLFMPITIKKEGDEGEEDKVFSAFVCKPNWFTFEQTEAAEGSEAVKVEEVKIPTWDYQKALSNLDIQEIEFSSLTGNSQGFARGRGVAINPLAVLPHKTRFHEMAHVVMGHTAECEMQDNEQTPRSIREVEAESVAFLLCALFELPGQAEARGYVQQWLDGQAVTAKSAARIFGAADKILKAGTI